MVKIRLRRMGAKKAPFYRIVVADSRYPRDGRFIEEIGIYNPTTDPAELKVDVERAQAWIKTGAQPVSYTHLIHRCPLPVSSVLQPNASLQRIVDQPKGGSCAPVSNQKDPFSKNPKGGIPGNCVKAFCFSYILALLFS